MKAQILKIAGVKSEKEFYKKFPTEESFMKVHGKALKKAQIGAMIQGSTSPQFNPKPINFQQLYDQNDMFITGLTQDERDQEALQLAELAAQQKGAKNGKKLKKALFGDETMPMGKSGMADMFGKVGKGISAGIGKAGGPMAVAQNVGNIVGGIQQMGDEADIRDQAKQMADVSGVSLKASMTRPEPVQRRYVRPDDPANIVQPGQLYNPLGYGTNILAAKNGTEIANTFAPNTIYTDLEEANNGGMFSNFKTNPDFLKLNSSGQQTDISKFVEQGGGDVISQLTSSIGNPKGYGPSGASRVGRGVGNTLGTIVGGPVAGAILGEVGSLAGNFLDRKAEDTEQARRTTDRNIMTMAFNQGTQGLQQQNYSYMRDGGMANPQVATSLEGIPLTRLFAPDPTMDTLRAGGHLKKYTPPSERAMYTGREQFAMGGKLKTHWGGHAETISYNPYLPEEGETVMFEGNSHDKSDGKGRTGIGVSYGDTGSDSYTDYAEYGTDAATRKANVEVEREPAVQLKDANTGDTSLTVYGNLELSEPNAELIGMPDQAKRKYKNIVADLSKDEQKQNKLIEKSVTELEKLDLNNPYNILSFESRKASLLGANMKLKKIADQKIKLAGMQSATNDTAEEFGLDADALAKGKVKQAKKGASINKAQPGGTYEDISDKIYRDALALEPLFVEQVDPSMDLDQVNVTASKLPTIAEMRAFKPTLGNLPQISPFYAPSDDEQKAGKFDWMTFANQILPYLRPSNAQPLDPRQLSGEILALATNQVEPVQAQTIQPQLDTPYDISLQDIINENEADYRAVQRLSGYNPAVLAALNAQKYAANQKVLGEQFRLNQAMRDKVFDENRKMLNQTGFQNLAIFDQQYGRQQEALSKTKATTQAALSSIASKYLQNQSENRTLQTYENLYNYRFDPRFRAMNMNPLAQFTTDMLSGLPAEQVKDLVLKATKATEGKAKNGALVKAIKSM